VLDRVEAQRGDYLPPELGVAILGRLIWASGGVHNDVVVALDAGKANEPGFTQFVQSSRQGAAFGLNTPLSNPVLLYRPGLNHSNVWLPGWLMPSTTAPVLDDCPRISGTPRIRAGIHTTVLILSWVLMPVVKMPERGERHLWLLPSP